MNFPEGSDLQSIFWLNLRPPVMKVYAQQRRCKLQYYFIPCKKYFDPEKKKTHLKDLLKNKYNIWASRQINFIFNIYDL